MLRLSKVLGTAAALMVIMVEVPSTAALVVKMFELQSRYYQH